MLEMAIENRNFAQALKRSMCKLTSNSFSKLAIVSSPMYSPQLYTLRVPAANAVLLATVARNATWVNFEINFNLVSSDVGGLEPIMGSCQPYLYSVC